MTTLAEMMEGPRTRIHQFNPSHWMTQVGWLGHRAGDFYPGLTLPTKGQEPGGYSPVYLEDGD